MRSLLSKTVLAAGLIAAAGFAFVALTDQRVRVVQEAAAQNQADGDPNHDASAYAKTPERVNALTRLQRWVTQGNGTERPFNNAYWDNKEPGIYVDIVSGEPLFASTTKYQSGTGWPSFMEPLEAANVVLKEDNTLGLRRTEVRSKHGDSHLGHVFNDGPGAGGLRWCINSAALRFVPVDQLEAEGYGAYATLFEDDAPNASYAPVDADM